MVTQLPEEGVVASGCGHVATPLEVTMLRLLHCTVLETCIC